MNVAQAFIPFPLPEFKLPLPPTQQPTKQPNAQPSRHASAQPNAAAQHHQPTPQPQP